MAFEVAQPYVGCGNHIVADYRRPGVGKYRVIPVPVKLHVVLHVVVVLVLDNDPLLRRGYGHPPAAGGDAAGVVKSINLYF